MKIELEYLNDLKLVGLKTTLRSSRIEKHNLSKIPKLWSDLNLLIENVTGRVDDFRYGAITGDLPGMVEEVSEYWALVKVKNFDHLPKGLLKLELTKSKIAKYEHYGPPQTVGETTIAVLNTELPKLNLKVHRSLELFRYPANYNRNDINSSFECFLFLEL